MKNPKKNDFDRVHEVAKIIAEITPKTKILSKLKSIIFPIGIEKRKEEFLDYVGETLEALPEIITKRIIEYFESEEGQTLLLKTLRAVYLTHKVEKYFILRNVLLNSAKDDAVSFDYKEICTELASELEPADVLLLKDFNQNKVDFAKCGSFEEIYKVCVGHGLDFDKDSFYLSLMKLKNKSLVRITEGLEGFDDVFSPSGLLLEEQDSKPCLIISPLGLKFIEYLKDLKA